MSNTNTATVTKLNLNADFDRKYKLVMYNDDTTPFDVVIVMLIQTLYKSEQDAINIAMHVHEHGKAEILVGSKEYLDAKCEVCIGFVWKFGYTDFKIKVEED